MFFASGLVIAENTGRDHARMIAPDPRFGRSPLARLRSSYLPYRSKAPGVTSSNWEDENANCGYSSSDFGLLNGNRRGRLLVAFQPGSN